MAHVQVLQKTFNDKEGKAVNYRVLAITGSVNGEPFTLELKGNKTELTMAKMLLDSTEELEVTSHPATTEEQDEFLSQYEE